MIIAQNFASKLAVAFVAIAMILMAVPSARAAEQTPEELQKTINDLLAQVAALKASTGGSSTGSSSSCEMIPAPLTMGASGASVTALQKRLIADGEAIAAGATGYFGAQTKAALASWQTKNAVSPAVGYYGPVTKAAMDAKCTPSTDDSDEDTDNGDADLSGEASLNELTIDSASDDTVEEGSEEAEVAEVTVNFEDGDASISRLDVSIDSTDATDPWDVLDTVHVMVDGDEVASVDASDEDNYLTEDDGTLRISGLDIVAMEDEDVDIVIAATFQDGIDSDDLGNYTVSVDSIRYFDADGVATTEVSGFDLGDEVTFTLEEAGTDDEIIVKTSAEDPESTTLQVEDDSKSDWYTVFAFDLDTKDSVNDLTLNTVKVEVTTNGASSTLAGYNDLVDDAELVIDGTTIDDVSVSGTVDSEGTAVLTFDVDGDVEISAGDRVGAELKLRFKSLASINEGTTVMASIDGDDTTIDAEGADDLTGNQVGGSATGDEHTLRTTGIVTEVSDDSATVTTGDGSGDDYATFTLKVDVTAFEQDAYVPTNASTIDADILSSTSSVLSASPTVVLTSTGKTVNNRFEITEGDTETLTVKVTYDPASTNVNAKMLLKSIGFYELSSGGTLQTQTTLPEEDYDTEVVTIVN